MILAVHGITRVGAVLVGQEASRVASHKWTITPVIVALVVLGGIRQMTYIGHPVLWRAFNGTHSTRVRSSAGGSG